MTGFRSFAMLHAGKLLEFIYNNFKSDLLYVIKHIVIIIIIIIIIIFYPVNTFCIAARSSQLKLGLFKNILIFTIRTSAWLITTWLDLFFHLITDWCIGTAEGTLLRECYNSQETDTKCFCFTSTSLDINAAKRSPKTVRRKDRWTRIETSTPEKN